MKILAVDTETNGLPVSWTAGVGSIDNWPRIVELAWDLFDENGTTIRKQSNLVIPDGWTIPDGDFWKEHGYDLEECAMEGELMPVLLDSFIEAVKEADLMIAHNMGFDFPVINCEMLRYGKKAKKIKTYCTKIESTEICGIKAGPGKNKWPTLEEAYRFLTGKEPLNAHHADADVEMCKQVYLYLQML